MSEQDDLDEMKMCLGDCQTQVSKEKDEVKKCTNKQTLRKFFFHTIPGQILLVLILYLLGKAIFSAMFGEE